MVFKQLDHFDLSQNELRNAKIQNLASDPGTPVEGQIWFNSTSQELKYYDGGAVQVVGTSSAAGTVTAVSVVSANGFAGSVATDTTTPAITLTTTVTGLLKGNGTAVSAASAGTDYLAPSGNGSALTGITQSQVSGSAPLASPTFTGTPAAPTPASSDNSTAIATTAYVTTAVGALAQGIQYKPTATVVATSALPAGTYSNGSSGVGATFTVTATGTTTVDGHVLAANDLVLLTAQASALQNGLYTVTTAGATGVATVLTRHADMDQAAEFSGAFIPVGSAGTSFANSLWLANPSGAVTVGTTSIPLTQVNGATEITAGTGLSKSGNTLSLTVPVSSSNGGAGSVSGLLKADGAGNVSAASYAATIGDGSSTSITVTHNLGTRDVHVTVYDASTYDHDGCGKNNATVNTVVLTFATAPATNALRVVVSL